MFFQTTVVAALAALAAATPLAVRTDSKCNTGNVHCCNTVSKESSYEKSKVAGLLALGALKGISGEIYSDCSPLVSLIGASSWYVSSQDHSFPINLNCSIARRKPFAATTTNSVSTLFWLYFLLGVGIGFGTDLDLLDGLVNVGCTPINVAL